MRKLAAILLLLSTSLCAQVAHPRIWLDSTTLTRLRAQIASTHYSGTAASDSSYFTALLASADSYAAMPVAPYTRTAAPDSTINYAYEGAGWLQSVQSLALAYQLTGNKSYSDKVKQILAAMADTGRVLSLTSVAGITVGMAVTGTNIPDGTTVISINASGDAYNTWPQLRLSNWMTDSITAGTSITVGGTAYATPTTSAAYCNLGPQDPQRVDSGYPSRNSALALALAYDWIYDQLSDTEKTNLAHVLETWWAQVNTNGYRWASASGSYGLTDSGCGNYAVGHLLGFSALAIAFEGDDGVTDDMFSNSVYGVGTRLSSRFLPQATSGCFASGYANESYSYGASNLIRLAQAMRAYQTAGKSALMGDFDVNAWLKQVITAAIYNQRPDNWGVSDEGDWAGQFSAIFNANLPYVSAGMLGSGTTESGYALWQVNHANYSAVPGGAPGPSYGFTVSAFNAFLYYDPAIAAADYTAALPAYWYGDGPGDYHTFARTDWTSSSIQTSFTGWNGKTTDHQSNSGGHIYVQRGADRLLVNAGQWNGTSGVVGSPSQFTQASWSLNTLYVYDSTTVPSGSKGAGYPYCAAYGCQGGSLSPTAPVAHRETKDFVYSKVDLASTYGNLSRGGAPITTYYRSFASIAGISFVYDYSAAVDYTNASRKQFWHTPALTSNSPAGIATNVAVNGSIASATVGASTIWIKSLLPATATITATNDLKGFTGVQTGTQRFEISDPDQNATAVTAYLTVLAPTDSSVSAMPATSAIAATGFVGALYNDGTPRAVLFSSDGTSRTSVTYTVVYDSQVAGRHAVFDLAPGFYTVRKDGVIIYSGVLVGKDGSLSFSSNGGATFSVGLAALPSAAFHGRGETSGTVVLR